MSQKSFAVAGPAMPVSRNQHGTVMEEVRKLLTPLYHPHGDQNPIQTCGRAVEADRVYNELADITRDHRPLDPINCIYISSLVIASEIPAITIEGLAAKAAALDTTIYKDDSGNLCPSVANPQMRLLASLIRDIMSIARAA